MNNDIAVRSPRSEVPATNDLPQPLPANRPIAEPVAQQPSHDAISLGVRARDLIGDQKVPEITPLSFWDHQTRTVPVGPRRVAIDASASYKLE